MLEVIRRQAVYDILSEACGQCHLQNIDNGSKPSEFAYF